MDRRGFTLGMRCDAKAGPPEGQADRGVRGERPDRLLPIILVVSLLAFLVVGITFFSQLVSERIYQERTAQLTNITSQVADTMDTALVTQWRYLDSAVSNFSSIGEGATPETVSQALARIETSLLNTDEYSHFMLLDEDGVAFDAEGRHGPWADFAQVTQDRIAFISHTRLYDGIYWAFVERLETPLPMGQDQAVWAVLLRNVQSMVPYYETSAYDGANETYILKTNGTRVHDDETQGNSITSYNVIRTIEEWAGDEPGAIIDEVAAEGVACSNFMRDGEELYYCAIDLEGYHTLLLVVIPAAAVAAGAVGLVDAAIEALLVVAVVLMVLGCLTVVAVTRQQASTRLWRQEQANAREQGELNARLSEANEHLEASKRSVEEAFEIAERANQAKSSFLSNMSHDIRTPMNAIVGFSTLLMRDAEDPERVRAHAKRITDSSQHLLGLINDVLDISKIEAGKTTLNLGEESLPDVIEACDSIIRPQMVDHGHRFEVRSIDIVHPALVMDRVRLSQILINLLSNAMKYTPDGGEVTFTIRELPSESPLIARFRFTVADTGIGMTPEFLSTIFDTFSREETSRTNKIQGTGLGMAISKHLVDLMGGSLEVESELDHGSTFTLELGFQISEVSSAPAPGAVSVEVTEPVNCLSGCHILAAEDNAMNTELLRELLDMEGATCDVYENGRLASEAFRTSEPDTYDLVLMDVQMPEMNGYEATRAIRESDHPRARTIPIVAMTADAFAEDVRRALDAGMNAHVSKPIDLSVLQRVTGEMLAAEDGRG